MIYILVGSKRRICGDSSLDLYENWFFISSLLPLKTVFSCPSEIIKIYFWFRTVAYPEWNSRQGESKLSTEST